MSVPSRDILELAAPPADYRLPYGPDPLHFGDLRLPAGPGPHPLAIVVHGGFWRSLYNLEYFGHACAALAARGIATWNIEYRRIGNPGGGWPGTFQDVAAAADHARALAAERGALMVPSYHRDLVVGVATYWWELLRAVPGLDVAYVPIGLGSGACALLAAKRALAHPVRVVGVVSRHATTYADSFVAGSAVFGAEDPDAMVNALRAMADASS